MGIYSDAYLIWGIPVTDQENPELWEDEALDWKDLPGDLEVRGYGHYEDPDANRGILTSSRVKHFSGDCWNAKRIHDLDPVPDKVLSKSNDQVRASGLDFDFYADAGWHLVGSVG